MWETLVVDSAAYIKLTRLELLGSKLYSPSSVISEVKDAKARQHVQLFVELPEVRDPEPRHVNFVKDFAAKTGDLKVLSRTDVEVIALAVNLVHELGLDSLLNSEPRPRSFVQQASDNPWSSSEVENKAPGVIQDSSPSKTNKPSDDVEDQAESEFVSGCIAKSVSSLGVRVKTEEMPVDERSCSDGDEINFEPVETLVTEGYLDNYDDDGCGDWVTSENFDRLNVTVERNAPQDTIPVACVTTDFAMQNVLLQMNIPLVSLDGLRIRSCRTWTQFCWACYSILPNATAIFCPKCGYSNISRTSLQVSADGLMITRPSRTPNLKGTIHPVPKGSKKPASYKKTYIYAADQLLDPGFQHRYRNEVKAFNNSMAAVSGAGLNTGDIGGIFSGNRNKNAPTVQVGYGRGNPNSNKWTKTHKRKF